MNIEDPHQRPNYEMFLDLSYFDMWCVRDSNDRHFNSPTSYHFDKHEDAIMFYELIKKSR